MKPRTVALRDQIVTTLRNNDPLPMTCKQIVDALKTEEHLVWYEVVYVNLQALTAKGVLTRVGFEGAPGRVMWRLGAGTFVDSQITEKVLADLDWDHT